MGMSGFICHDDYYDRLKRLSDEEVGNLFRQLMLYHAGRFDEMSDFIDSEGIAFDFIVSDIERIEAKQNETSETNRINGSKGGRPKKQKEPTETEENRLKPTENRLKPTETDRNPTKAYKEKDKDKDIYINNISSAALIADDDAHEIQSEQNRILDAADDAGFPKSNTVRAKLIDLYAEHGMDKMLNAINECVTHSAVSLAYLQAVLRGGPSKQKPPKVIAQDFVQ